MLSFPNKNIITKFKKGDSYMLMVKDYYMGSCIVMPPEKIQCAIKKKKIHLFHSVLMYKIVIL